jgi:hypothetical protein
MSNEFENRVYLVTTVEDDRHGHGVVKKITRDETGAVIKCDHSKTLWFESDYWVVENTFDAYALFKAHRDAIWTVMVHGITKPDNDAKRHRRTSENIEDRKRRNWIFDFDAFAPPEGMSPVDPFTVKALLGKYAPELAIADMVVKFSSSAGTEAAKGKVKAHVFMRTTEAFFVREMRRYVEAINARAGTELIDSSPFKSPNNFVILADPLIEDGIECLVKDRLTLIEGDEAETTIVIPEIESLDDDLSRLIAEIEAGGNVAPVMGFDDAIEAIGITSINTNVFQACQTYFARNGRNAEWGPLRAALLNRLEDLKLLTKDRERLKSISDHTWDVRRIDIGGMIGRSAKGTDGWLPVANAKTAEPTAAEPTLPYPHYRDVTATDKENQDLVSDWLKRVREGDAPSVAIAKAKSEGKYKGRKPTAPDKVSEVRRLRDEGVGATAIAKQVGIGRATVYRIIGGSNSIG